LDVAQRARRPASPLAASAPVATLEDADDDHAADALEEADARDAAPVAPSELEEQVTRLERLERVAVDPLVGRLVPGGELLLTRTVLIGDRGLRQGLVIEPERLERTLRATLPRGVPVAHFQLVEPAAPPSGTAYRHRFAEPFDPIAAELVLGPIAAGRGSLAVTALAGLFVAASALGLFALYRMTAVTVEFAERRGNFVAAVSHELKTPLTAIRMYAEMLRDGLVPNEAKQREYFASITTESERLSRLINNVLEFSRLEKGTHSVDLRIGDVRPVVLEAVELLAPHAERHGQQLELDAPDGLPTVRFERDALLQVLFNLVDNAVKYAKDASEPVIRVSLREKAGGVELRVRDHGPGVPPGQERRILEPFHRAEDELTRRTQGTGIGLALVRGLVEEMGAAFEVGDAEGGGFEARIRLAPA
jgi:signal transduction histidine kinase